MLKRIIQTLLMTLVAVSALAQGRSNIIDEVVWVVGDEAILKSDVENYRIEAQQQGMRLEGDPYCVIPEQLAMQKLFLTQAAIDSVEVSDADVFSRVDMDIQGMIMQAGSREKLEEYAGKSVSQIRETMFNNYRDRMIVDEVQRNLMSGIKVTPAQVRRYFKDLPEDSIPFIPTKVECQIITRNPRISQEEIDRVKNELRDYTDRVNKGDAQFSTLALLYSEDKGSAVNGGELGFSSRTSFVPEFANVAFNLTDPKTVSKIVETEFGFHIIQLIEKRGDLVNCRHILRKPRVAIDSLQQCINDLDSIKAEIDRGLYTFDECVHLVSYDKDTRNNYGLLFDKNDNTSQFQMKDLPTEVARAVAGMKVGDISAPFIMIDSKGKEVVAIVKLKSRTNGHRATMVDDYQELQAVVLSKLREEKIESWIREKQKTMYVHINEDWVNCEFKYPGWIKNVQE